jgi:hypothetical protein
MNKAKHPRPNLWSDCRLILACFHYDPQRISTLVYYSILHPDFGCYPDASRFGVAMAGMTGRKDQILIADHWTGSVSRA